MPLIKLKDLLGLIRFVNLIIIALTQILVFVFLREQPDLKLLYDPNLWLIVFATCMISAAGYIINDYFDVKIDMINKPQKVVVATRISMRSAIAAHWVLSLLSFLIGLSIDLKIAIVFLFVTALLVYYSASLKRKVLTGNLLIAALMGFAPVVLYIYDPSMDINWLGFYVGFAFLTGLLREIVKDVEDMKGDLHFNSQTLPLAFGFYKTKLICISLASLLLIALIAAISLFYYYGYLIFACYFLFLILPLNFYLIYLISISDKSRDYGKLSMVLKILMFVGLLSILLRFSLI